MRKRDFKSKTTKYVSRWIEMVDYLNKETANYPQSLNNINDIDNRFLIIHTSWLGLGHIILPVFWDMLNINEEKKIYKKKNIAKQQKKKSKLSLFIMHELVQ